MPIIDPVSAAVTYLAAAVILGCGAAWLGSIGAVCFDVWLSRRRMHKRIERAIDDMHCGAPEGGRKHRPF